LYFHLIISPYLSNNLRHKDTTEEQYHPFLIIIIILPYNITEAFDPIIKFRKYRAFDNGAVMEFYSLLKSAMLGARKAGLFHHLVNYQTLPVIMAWMPMGNWKQWDQKRPMDWRPSGGRILGLHSLEVEVHSECSGGRAHLMGPGRRLQNRSGGHEKRGATQAGGSEGATCWGPSGHG
jgi:hypothetical protein